MTERSRLARAPEDILIAILTQTESQQTGLSSVQITIDHKSPDLQNIALESTRNLFVQQSADTYKASQINISVFINILIGVKANGWTLMGTNAFLNNAKQEVVKTFYFEKIGSTRTAVTSVYAKYNNNASSSSPAVRAVLAQPAVTVYTEPYTDNRISNTENRISHKETLISNTESRISHKENLISNTDNRITAAPINGLAVASRLTPDGSPNVPLANRRPSGSTDVVDHRSNGLALIRRNSYQETTPEPAILRHQTSEYTLPSSSPPPPPDSKSPTPGAIDFNKFPARLRPSPTGKGDKGGVSTVTSEIQKKNAEYFKRMKKVNVFFVHFTSYCASIFYFVLYFIFI